jgi:hypothetical protein
LFVAGRAGRCDASAAPAADDRNICRTLLRQDHQKERPNEAMNTRSGKYLAGEYFLCIAGYVTLSSPMLSNTRGCWPRRLSGLFAVARALLLGIA